MSLNVIALVSGGKDSFFSLLHCLAHGHRVVALANLYPADAEIAKKDGDNDDAEEDLNSFMYQTVGHQVLPLYAAATGLPVYREPIRGQAVQSGREYHHYHHQQHHFSSSSSSSSSSTRTGADENVGEDETESMTRLLRKVMAAHPEANAVCAGALLSTYQRTRVESVAVRLGLMSLAYLWKYTTLPGPLDYLADLAAAGFDARIIKVASGGLDEALLWTNVADPAGRARLQRALQRLGLLDGGAGSALGEGGEYETLVVDGPRSLFGRGSIAVADADRRVVHEGGGTAWLQIKGAKVVGKEEEQEEEGKGQDTKDVNVNRPPLLDARFAAVLAVLRAEATDAVTDVQLSLDALSFDNYDDGDSNGNDTTHNSVAATGTQPPITTWRVVPEDNAALASPSIADATQSIVDQVRKRLSQTFPSSSSAATTAAASPTLRVVRTLVVLRRMADFPAFNAVYGTLFSDAPNPPSRVTIACGEALPAGVDVVVLLAVLDAAAQERAGRQGLHVQSRSYWAPANIGPYSQAVSVLANAGGGSSAVAALNNSSGPRIVSIAGQIPLVPASMELPTEAVEAKEDGGRGSDAASASSSASFAFHATLALQHLWRIGLDLDVQWWGSAVAYVPKEMSSSSSTLLNKALSVARAWRTAHTWRPKEEGDDDNDNDNEDDVDDDDGPDLWDRKFDARYTMYGHGSEADTPQLPDWSVLSRQGGAFSPQSTGAIPPVFLAEVQELPRSAPVEWHAQAGWSRVQPGQGSSYIQCRSWSDKAAHTRSYQTILTMTPPDDDSDDDDDDYDTTDNAKSRPAKESQLVVQTTTAWTRQEDAAVSLSKDTLVNAEVVYADMSSCQIPDSCKAVAPVVPCTSLWDSHGQQLAAVVVRTEYGTKPV
ncbi:MAG: hypothetical protein STHCBS139747_002933 [Sporothrix thermara]